jgi:hypothetical protein
VTITIRKASKKKTKIRGAFYGPSGAGKTLSALRIATGLARFEGGGTIPAEGRGRIGAIDSEDGDVELYADRFDFDTVTLGVDTPGKTIRDYVQALDAFAAAGASVVVIDSISHAWRELLEFVDGKKRGGNSFSAWADATPMQKEFVAALKSFPGHVIATMRSDTAWEITTNDAGKKEPKRLGLKPEQGKGMEYEFSFLVFIDTDHRARVEKDRTGKFQDRNLDLLTEAFGGEIGAWLADGAKPVTVEQKATINALCKQNGIGGARFTALVGGMPATFEAADEAIEKLRAADPTALAQAAAAAGVKVVVDSPHCPGTDKDCERACAGTDCELMVERARHPPSASTGSGIVDAITKGEAVLAAQTPPTATTPTAPPSSSGDAGERKPATTTAKTTTSPSPRAPTGASAGSSATASTAPATKPATSAKSTASAEQRAADDLGADLAKETSTTVLLAFKRACDSSRTLPEVATTIANWRAKLDQLKPRVLMVANGYAAGRLKDLVGEPKTEDENRWATSLNDLARE